MSFADVLSTFRTNRRIWDVRHAPRKRVRELVAGEIAVVAGAVDADTLLRAPLTLAPCVAFAIRCAQHRPDLGMEQRFATAEGRATFRVVDEDGEAIRVDEGETILGIPLVDVTAEVSAELARVVGEEAAARARQKGARLAEGRVAPLDRVLVRGRVIETEEVVARGYRGALGRVLCLRGTLDEPLVLCRA